MAPEEAEPTQELASRGEAFQAEARVLRRNWFLPLAGLATAIAGYLLGDSNLHQAPFGLVLVLLGVVFAGATATRSSHPLSRRVELRATPGSFTIDASPPILATDVVEAKLVPKPGSKADIVADLTLRDGRRWPLWMKRPDAVRLFSLLGVHAGERRATFRLALPLRVRFLVTALGVGLPWGLWIQLSQPGRQGELAFLSTLFLLTPLCVALAWLLGVLRGRLVIGADGFTTRWLGRERFVRFADVTAVEGETPFMSRGIIDSRVSTTSGRRLRLRTPEVPDAEAQRGVEGKALFMHLRLAWDHFHERAAQADLRAALGRGGRDDGAWLAHLDGLVRGGAMRYRIAALDPEQLAQVALDPKSPPDCRIGAAAALVRLDASHRPRVHVAASACAQGDLQAALAALAEAEDDAGVQAALERGRRAELTAPSTAD